LRYPDAPTTAPAFPFVALLASGGHTALYRVDGPELAQMRELGATRDDAAGEAFDKVAKLLGLGYPGGPSIDRLAREGDARRIELSWPMRAASSPEFSFSGLKTCVARYIEKRGPAADDQHLRDLCAAFQSRVVETLVSKAVLSARKEDVRTLVLGGGVAANRELRERARLAAEQHHIALVVPPMAACTDNAAMIAYAGSLRLVRGEDDRHNLTTSPHTALLTVTRKGRGRRGAILPGA
jgi:N6-L-threonylcarbamoyladenine synthase